MKGWFFTFGALLLALNGNGAERVFDFSIIEEGSLPPGFVSLVTGHGKPGVWKIISDEVPSQMPAMKPGTASVVRSKVLAQISRDITDEHFPLLLYNEEIYGDFTFTTQFKIAGGAIEQMAGVAFRIQDEKNYYVVRASALGGNFRFYKFVNGQRSPPIGPSLPIAKGVWQELTVECKGNKIRCLLNGKEAIPPLTDNSFISGKIGFWTKSDSVSYFHAPHIQYVPRESLAQKILVEALERYPRLVGLRIYARAPGNSQVKVIASTAPAEIGTPGSQVEEDVLTHNSRYNGKSEKNKLVTLPLHDRNGDTVAVLRVVLESFPGQTDDNALARALPVAKFIDSRISTLKDLVE